MHKKELKESLSWAGKLFFAGVLSYVNGKGNIPKIPLKLKLTQEEKEIIYNVISASKDFHDELKKPNAKIEIIMEKLKKRNDAKKTFFKHFKINWPL